MDSDMSVNKMVLGTVQLGMDYGISNTSGMPTSKEAYEILSFAWEKGIRVFDTAPGYGSENLLGEFIKTNGLQNEVKILTKIPSQINSRDHRESIRSSIDSSLDRLGCNIEMLFFHNPTDSILLKRDPDFFEQLLSDYSFLTLGVSVYDTNEVEELSSCPFGLGFQFPYNVLDRRFSGFSMPVGKRFARSIFLQGLLATRGTLKSGIPGYVLELHEKYHTRLAKHSLNPVQYALSFVAQSTSLDYFLFGVDNLGQLANIFSTPLYDDTLLSIMDTFSDNLDSSILDPRKWN